MHRHTLPLSKRLTGVTRSAPAASPARAPVLEPAAAREADDAQAMRGMLDSLASIVANARKQRLTTVADLAHQSVELGVAIAERLLGAGITLDRQRLDLIVLTSLARLPTNTAVALRGHPDDIALLHRQVETNASAELSRENLTFQRDETCERGRLILEADDLFVEWDTQHGLAELRSLLFEQVFTET